MFLDKKFPLWLQILLIPIFWIMAAVKLLIVIPIMIIGFCNSVSKDLDVDMNKTD